MSSELKDFVKNMLKKLISFFMNDEEYLLKKLRKFFMNNEKCLELTYDELMIIQSWSNTPPINSNYIIGEGIKEDNN